MDVNIFDRNAYGDIFTTNIMIVPFGFISSSHVRPFNKRQHSHPISIGQAWHIALWGSVAQVPTYHCMTQMGIWKTLSY